jgi:cytochrome oxidase Cu insertion factor (SCO1/SenC/PrrC family)
MKTARTTRASPRLSAMVIVAALSLSAGVAAMPAQAPPLPDVQALGPAVGERVPDFTLPDQHGESRTLASLMGANGLVLVFYRSADW